jgi:nitrile hydratase
MGGMHGFGPVVVERDEPVFRAPWEGRVLGMAFQVVGFGWTTLDAFRHGIERLAPVEYLTAGYYGRWLAALQTLLAETGVLAAGEVDARLAGHRLPPRPLPPHELRPAVGFTRATDTPPRFRAGDAVRGRNLNPAGHTRLARYLRGRRGVVQRAHGAFVFPDTNAHGRGEQPQHLYNVRFDATELWGPAAEPAAVHADLFESYLDPA